MALGELCPPANPRTLRYTGAYFYLLPKKWGIPNHRITRYERKLLRDVPTS